MAINAVLQRHNKEIEGAGQGYFCFVSKGKDLKMIHDENDVLTNNELIVARDFLKSKNMDVYTHKMNFLVGLGC